MGHVLIKLWRPITFELITDLTVFIHHTLRLIDLSKNNYVAKLANNLFKSYDFPEIYKNTVLYITNI